MKPNPCILCRKQPTVDTWADKGYAAYCYHDLDTHSIQCHGKTRQAAIRRWNRLNVIQDKTHVR
jgi:hypothetical protein